MSTMMILSLSAGLLLMLGALLVMEPVWAPDFMDDGFLVFLALLGAIAGGIILIILLWRFEPDFQSWLLLVIPMTLGTIGTSWRLWSEGERKAPFLIGIVPFVLAAFWVWRDPVGGGAVTLGALAAAVIGGAAWHFSKWRDPRWQIRITEMVDIGGAVAGFEELLKGAADAEDKKTEILLRQVAAKVSVRHAAEARFPLLLAWGAVALAWYLPLSGNGFGLLGGLGIAASVPPIVFWLRGTKDRLMRAAFLGPGFAIHESIFVATIAFAAGQTFWLLKAI